MPSFSGPNLPSNISVVGVSGKPSTPRKTPFLNCCLANNYFAHSFLIIPSCPTPLLGRDILSTLKASISMPTNSSTPLQSPHDLLFMLCACAHDPPMPPPPPIFPIFVHPQVWDTSIPVIAACHPPVLVKLKDPTVTLEVCSSLNPATLLPDPLKPPHTKHSCPEVLEAQPLSHLHLHARPLQNAQLTLFVDGSSFINP